MQILGEEKPARTDECDGDDGKRVSAPDGKRDKPNPEEMKERQKCGAGFSVTIRNGRRLF